MNLFLITKDEADNGFLPMQDERSKHIINILKLKNADTLHAGILNQDIGIATIDNIASDKIFFSYKQTNKALPLLNLKLVLACARPLVMKRLLRDISAMGVSEIAIFNAQNGEKSYLESSLWTDDEYIKHVHAGLSLSKQVIMPKITKYSNLLTAINDISTDKSNNLKIALDATGIETFKTISKTTSNIDSITLVVGSERGLSSNELSLLIDNNFTLINMGSRIVRTETACVMAVALASQKII